MSTKVLTCVTCMDVRERGYVHDVLSVFRALLSVPRGCFAFLEFQAEESFEYTVNLESGRRRVWQSPPVIVTPPPSGRVTRVAAVPLRLVRALPGAYNVTVELKDQPAAKVERGLFFGEM